MNDEENKNCLTVAVLTVWNCEFCGQRHEAVTNRSDNYCIHYAHSDDSTDER
jgi:hypothetical protein